MSTTHTSDNADYKPHPDYGSPDQLIPQGDSAAQTDIAENDSVPYTSLVRSKKSKDKVEFRYYDIPAGEYMLPLLGERWEMEYGTYAKSIGHPGMLHFHNYLEIGYCYRGHGKVVIADTEYRYDDEEAFTFIPKYVLHTTTSDPGSIDKWEFMFVNLDDFVRNEMRGLAIPPEEILRIVNQCATMGRQKDYPAVAGAVRGMMEECRKQRPYYKENVKNYLKAVVIGAMRFSKEKERTPGESNHDAFVEKALNYIEQHYMDEDLRIADIAASCNLSESRFRKVFVASLGMTPGDYLNMVRVNCASEQLAITDDLIERIGKSVGYQNTPSFIRNFKALTGKTPLQWRKDAQQNSMQKKNFNISAVKGWGAEEDN